MPTDMPTEGNGPTSWWMVWGEIQKEFGALRSDIAVNRQQTRDLIGSLLRRQDDMRRETVMHIARIDHTLEVLSMPKAPEKHGWGYTLLHSVPSNLVTQLLVWLLGILGALGWVRPEWIRFLSGSH